jgi:NAD(P)-dependent dehydrogenase (short-subunit alcohol dehydrogenase family)
MSGDDGAPPTGGWQFSGRTAMVTGAASGIGRALALALADAGARVALADLQPDALRETAAAVSVRGAASFAQPVDISNEDGIGEFVALVHERLGPIELLANVAGIFIAVPFTELSEEAWDRNIAINLTGTFLCCRAVLPGMLGRRYGKIVNFSSELFRTGAPDAAAYAASKGGIVSFTRSLAKEVAAAGIQVNVVAPGLTDTAQPRAHLSEAQMQELGLRIPMRRMGQTADIVEPTLFFLSDHNTYITGQVLHVGGGEVCW